MHLLINTGGGDAPGLNAVIRAVTLSALRRGFRVTGIRRGYSGLLEAGTAGLMPLDRDVMMVVELMGRYAGWLALHAGLAGAAHVILLPELDFDVETVCGALEHRFATNRPFAVVVVAEGAKPRGSGFLFRMGEPGEELSLGGVGAFVAAEIARRTGLETRSLVLGHLQRGGPPTASDRVLALRYGAEAVRLAAAGAWGRMVSFQDSRMTSLSFAEALKLGHSVPPDDDAIQTARDFGVCLGDRPAGP